MATYKKNAGKYIKNGGKYVTDCGVTCADCSGDTPSTIAVTFAGAVNGTCSDCTNYNSTTYILSISGPCSWTGTGECGQTLQLDVSVGGGIYTWVLQMLNDAGHGGGIDDQFRSAIAGSLDCMAEADLTWESSGGGVCAMAFATVHLVPSA